MQTPIVPNDSEAFRTGWKAEGVTYNPMLTFISVFLAAGKTTAFIGKAVAHLRNLGLCCAVVGNYESAGLINGVSARLLGEVLFLNKMEVLRKSLETAVAETFPEKGLRFDSAKAETGVAEWITACLAWRDGSDEALASSLADQRHSLAVDIAYEVYSRGWGILGRYNVGLGFARDAPLDGNKWLLRRTGVISAKLEQTGCNVAQFKMSLENEGNQYGAAVVSQARGGEPPVFSRTMTVGIERSALSVKTCGSWASRNCLGPSSGKRRTEQPSHGRAGPLSKLKSQNPRTTSLRAPPNPALPAFRISVF